MAPANETLVHIMKKKNKIKPSGINEKNGNCRVDLRTVGSFLCGLCDLKRAERNQLLVRPRKNSESSKTEPGGSFLALNHKSRLGKSWT